MEEPDYLSKAAIKKDRAWSSAAIKAVVWDSVSSRW